MKLRMIAQNGFDIQSDESAKPFFRPARHLIGYEVATCDEAREMLGVRK